MGEGLEQLAAQAPAGRPATADEIAEAEGALPFKYYPWLSLPAKGLTSRWSQPPAAVKSTFDFTKQFLMFAALAAGSGAPVSSARAEPI